MTMEPPTGSTQPVSDAVIDHAGATVEGSQKGGEAWSIDFSVPKIRRRTTKKEREAIVSSRLRQQLQKQQLVESVATGGGEGPRLVEGLTADSENNRHLKVVSVDGMSDTRTLIPTNLTTTSDDLAQRICLRLPRLLSVAKQYPKSCGVTSLTSVWNYLYTRIGETAVGAARPLVSQEEIMTILGFAPPFDEITWGPFTGNGTLFRWFHAINRHFGVRGRAYMLYKPQGKCRTSCSAEEALRELKRVLQNPHASVVYHCHNHYMVPIGYQEIPCAQTDFYAKTVPEGHTDTIIFIGEVSRGRHDALYAKKWEEIVKDLMCCSPEFYNIRRPDLGIQTRLPKKKKSDNRAIEQQQHENDGDEEEHKLADVDDAPAVSAAVDVGTESGVDVAGIEKRVKRKDGGNLHCLMCFRSDEEEPCLDRYENQAWSHISDGDDSEENVN